MIEPFEPAVEEGLEEDEEDDLEIIQSQDYQRDRIVDEIIYRMRTKEKSIPGEFWPSR